MDSVAARRDTEFVFGGTSARFHAMGDSLLGRERESAEVDGLLRDPTGPKVVVVRGERGVGRSAFTHAAAERLRAEGVAVLPVTCVPDDAERPLLLALRLVLALEEHRTPGRRPTASRPRPEHKPAAAAAVAAVKEGDGGAMAEALAAALAQPVPTAVVVDDAQHADPESLALLGRFDFEQVLSGTRLMVTAVRHIRPSDRTARPALTGPHSPYLERLARHRAAHTIVLPRLGQADVTALVTRRLRAVPDAGLVRRVYRLSSGIPGAVDALLAEWVGRDAIRMADGHAFLGVGTPAPVLPDGDRYVLALRALGEPCWTVASALSILWPLGRPAVELLAMSTGLSAKAVDHAIRTLVDEGIVDELHEPNEPTGRGGTVVRGWSFRVPLLAHSVRERLGPLERGRLSAAAVEALWADGAAGAIGSSHGAPAAVLLDEADAQTYLPDRIAEAGVLVDPERAVAELTTAARALYPDLDRRGMLRWYLGAVRLIEEPSTRALTVLRCGQAAHGCGDYATARAAAEGIVSAPAEGLDPPTLYEAATLLVASAAAERDWPALSRMSAASWWDGLPLPVVATVSGRVQALWQLEKWQEALALLTQTEQLWQTTPDSRALLELFSVVAEFVLDRPDRFMRVLTMPPVPELPRAKVFAIAIAQLDVVLGTGDLRRARALLAARGLAVELLPLCSQFLLWHLEGRWDEALPAARRLLVNGGVLNVVPGHQLIPARTAAVLLARGRVTTAGRLISSARGQGDGPLEHVLDHAEAEVLRTVGDLGRAEEILRRGLSAADDRGSVYGTDELWASLAEVHAEAGHTREALACLERLERLARRMDSGRTRLLYLLTSARVSQPKPQLLANPAQLLEAVELARERGQMFETAVTLTAAATATATATAQANAGPAALLHEAYELFGETGAALWRFRTRAAMRETGVVVPGRRQATAENEHLLATLLAEGLTNRQIAGVLRLTEDAVANRLSRLFARTGMRSRTEVVTAVLGGGPLSTEGR